MYGAFKFYDCKTAIDTFFVIVTHFRYSKRQTFFHTFYVYVLLHIDNVVRNDNEKKSHLKRNTNSIYLNNLHLCYETLSSCSSRLDFFFYFFVFSSFFILFLLQLMKWRTLWFSWKKKSRFFILLVREIEIEIEFQSCERNMRTKNHKMW